MNVKNKAKMSVKIEYECLHDCLQELIGRKTTILLTALPFIVAGLMVTYADGVALIYAGRSITGFCIG